MINRDNEDRAKKILLLFFSLLLVTSLFVSVFLVTRVHTAEIASTLQMITNQTSTGDSYAVELPRPYHSGGCSVYVSDNTTAVTAVSIRMDGNNCTVRTCGADRAIVFDTLGLATFSFNATELTPQVINGKSYMVGSFSLIGLPINTVRMRIQTLTGTGTKVNAFCTWIGG
jgi:hypothetical protein